VPTELGGPRAGQFLRILTVLWRRQSDTDRRDVPEGAGPEIDRVHRLIADAVVAGNEGLARHRMRRHLAALTEGWH
jgi:DNA-binding FadR family transcriptional regulator